MKLDIKNFDNFGGCDIEEKDKPKHFLLPVQPARILICGPSGCGKTNLLLNLIFKFLKFDRIYIYSKHIEQQKYRDLVTFFEDLQEQVLEETGDDTPILFTGTCLEDIVDVGDLDSSMKNLIVIDDFVTEKDQKVISDLFVRGRHKNATVMYLSQSYFMVPRPIRLNCSQLTIFNVDNRKELSLLYNELGTDVDKERFFEMYNKAVENDYSFFYIDRSSKFKPAKYRRNFDELFSD